VRAATRKDKDQMLQLYNIFTRNFVGAASRTLKPFHSMFRKKDNINYVALDGQNRMVGYVHATYEKRNNGGEFRDIVVDPKYDFVLVASLLVEKVNSAFTTKKVASIIAGSLRNPAYEKIFPKLGFMESESMGVFMYAVLDVRKLLNELEPVFISRLRKAEDWNGLAQIQCDEHSLFLEKTGQDVKPVVWTNRSVDFKVRLAGNMLAKLIFGVADLSECLKNGQLQVETKLSNVKATKLLERFFPRSQFLTLDFW